MEPCRTGSIVISTRGRDKNGVYAVIGTVQGTDGRQFVLIADGCRHPLENPKKKNPIHLQTMRLADERLIEALEDGGLTNARLVGLLAKMQHHA